MASIFDLKTSVNELSSANQEASRMQYEQQAPTRDVTQNNFSNGAIHFRFQTSGQKWWVPSKSYLRFRCQLTKADGTQLTNADKIAPAMNIAPALFQSMEMRINGKSVSRVADFVPQIDSLDNRLNKSASHLDSIGNSTNFWQSSYSERLNHVTSDGTGRKTSEFELTWTPCLSLFKVGSALPSGDYELVLNPQTSSVYQKYAVETEAGAGDKTPNLGAVVALASGDYAFRIVDMYLMVNTVEGPRVDNIDYLLELDQTTAQTESIDSVNFHQNNFDVSPTTHALTVAYVDARAGTDTQVSSTKLRSYDAGVATSQELALNRFFVNYAGQNLPAPDADPSFVAGTDYTTQRYTESQIYSGAMFDTGGAETIEEFHERGSYYHFAWPRDFRDKSTRVQVHQGFNNGTDVANMRVMLFDHSKQVVSVSVRDGRVVNVNAN